MFESLSDRLSGILNALTRRGALSEEDVNAALREVRTALLEAVILGDGGKVHTEIVRLLLARGAKPGLADRDGVTPLAHAQRRGYQEMARLIRAAGGT